MTPLRRDAGMSSFEVILMASIMSVLMIMITESMATLNGVRHEQRTQFQIGDALDRIARRIDDDVDKVTRIFVNTPVDTDYLLAMELGFEPLAGGNRLPALTAHGFFEPDPTGVAETGNVLFVARRTARVAVQCEALGEYHVQPFVFTVTAPIDTGTHLDVLRWNSQLIANYWDLLDVPAGPARTEVLVQLWENNVRYAWDETSPRASGLFEISASGTLQQLAIDKQVGGKEDPTLSRSLGRLRLALARNGTGGSHKVPAFARAVGAFPGGIEVKVDGATAGKLVLLRLVAETRSPAAQTRHVTGEVLRFLSTQS